MPDETHAAGDVYPVTWYDVDGRIRNTWSRNDFTGELLPDPDGDPLYTTVPPEGHP